jgi:hypothetical protein
MHGIYSVVERSWMKSNYYVAHFKEKKFAIVSGWVLTMIFVCIAWIFFRATSFTNAKEICLSAWKGILNLNNYAIQFRGIGWKPSAFTCFDYPTFHFRFLQFEKKRLCKNPISPIARQMGLLLRYSIFDSVLLFNR